MPVSKNDAIFCNPILSIPNFKEIENWENGIVFAYKFVPFNSSFSLKMKSR